MIRHYRHTLLPVIAGAALLMGGCGVTPEQLSEVRAIAEGARSVADEALRTANTADYQAHQAKIMADEALTNQQRIMKKLGMKKMMK